MSTFTTLIWITAIGMYLWQALKLIPPDEVVNNRKDESPEKAIGIFSAIWLIVVFIITSALIFDIFGIRLSANAISELIGGKQSVSGVSRTLFFFISGLVALGSCSLISLILNSLMRRQNYYRSNQKVYSNRGIGGLVIQIIGLIGSILGIIGFYLDHLR